MYQFEMSGRGFYQKLKSLANMTESRTESQAEMQQSEQQEELYKKREPETMAVYTSDSS